MCKVSIHATLAGGDDERNNTLTAHLIVSIHATLAGGDFASKHIHTEIFKFLSTPPSRVATKEDWVKYLDGIVSIHATLAGGDLIHDAQDVASRLVSIHATLAGGDRLAPLEVSFAFLFLSTPPSRVATMKLTEAIYDAKVSIHATLAGGDK